MGAPFQPRTVYDDISTLEAGCNSGLDPILLQKNQASFLTNVTVRGGFATHRPPIRKLQFVWPDPLVQAMVEGGLWQGGGWYRTDFNQEYIIAAISGRIFRFDIVGVLATVTDISIPGDLNDPTVTQVWMWQAEKWMIINDGLKLPQFWDNNTMRRSYGPSALLSRVTATPLDVPEIGDSASFTLLAPFPGPYNVPVIFNGHFYQPIENTAGYNATLLNLYDPTPGTVAVGTNVTVEPVKLGYMLSPISIVINSGAFPENYLVYNVLLSAPYTGSLNSRLLINGKIWVVTAIFNTPSQTIQIRNVSSIGVPGFSAPTGTLVTYVSSPGPNVIIGTVSTAFVKPGIGSSVIVTLSQSYTGSAGQSVWIGAGQYSITAIAAGPGSTALIMVNLTDVASAAYPTPIIAPDYLPIVSVPELPAGRMGAYGESHVAMCLVDGLSVIYGDTVGGPAGTAANDYRDAVLKTTENDFLAGRGAFRIPSSGDIINAMWYIAILDHALGQGPLQVGTALKILSFNVPTDFTDWTQLTQPILGTSLKGQGPMGQHSTISANSDSFFRLMNGIGSLKLARREFQTEWGNAPVSSEMDRVVILDNKDLLAYSSAVGFDNRLMETCSPQASNQGVFHAGLIVMDFDPISNLRDKLPSVWDGLWTGMNTLQTISDTTGKRAYAFGLNVPTEKIELYEIQRGTDAFFDNGNIPITWAIETASLFNKDVKRPDEWIQLSNGELGVSDVIGRVDFEVQYKPDKYNCWVPWHRWSICVAPGSKPVDFPAMGFGTPRASDCDPVSGRPYRDCLTAQVRLVFRGHCIFKRMRVSAVTIATPDFAKPICNVDCETTAPVPVVEFWNTVQSFTATCPDGETGDPVTVEIAAHTVSAETQEAADSLALQIATAQANANLVCSGGPSETCAEVEAGLAALLGNSYGLVGYVDGDIPNPSGPVPGGGAVVYDGTFTFTNGTSEWYARDSAGTETKMDGEHQLCNGYLTFVCVSDVPTWRINFRSNEDTFYCAEKIGGMTPEGVYINSGCPEVLPATIEIELIVGASTNIGSQDSCLPS